MPPIKFVSTFLTLLCVAVLVFVAAPEAIAEVDEVAIEVPLTGIAHEMVFDKTRQRFYVSIPAMNEVLIVSIAPFGVQGSFVFGDKPRGVDISHDDAKLFVALKDVGAVGVVDLATSRITSIPIGEELDDPRTWDVIEAQPDRLFVTSNPSSNGFAYVVQVQINGTINTATRVASNQIIRARPIMEVSPDRNFLYVGAGFSPNSLYKLDLRQSHAPVILEDDHGSVYGTSYLEVSPDGSKIHLRSGQILRTGSFLQDGDLANGLTRYGAAPGVFYHAQSTFQTDSTNISIGVYDAETYVQRDTIMVPCSAPLDGYGSIREFHILPGDSGFLLLKDDVLCGSVVPGGLPDTDEDGVADAFDNCADDPNVDQGDRDGDGFGDVCDPFPDDVDHLASCSIALNTCQDMVTQLEAEIASLRARVAKGRKKLSRVRGTN